MRVLLQSPRGAASFTGATRAGGRASCDPATTYYVRPPRRDAGRAAARARPAARRPSRAPLQVTGRGARRCADARQRARNGAYRGALEFAPGAFSGRQRVNARRRSTTTCTASCRRESPPSWPLEALKAQAVAARTYAITTAEGGAGFDQYADTRSQVYGGVGGETAVDQRRPSPRRAAQVVTYHGQPVVTYFFSTSGGRTENVENTPLGNEPRAVAEVGRRPLRRRLARATAGGRSS